MKFKKLFLFDKKKMGKKIVKLNEERKVQHQTKNDLKIAMEMRPV